jgi:hypothetical protein
VPDLAGPFACSGATGIAFGATASVASPLSSRALARRAATLATRASAAPRAQTLGADVKRNQALEGDSLGGGHFRPKPQRIVVEGGGYVAPFNHRGSPRGFRTPWSSSAVSIAVVSALISATKVLGTDFGRAGLRRS